MMKLLAAHGPTKKTSVSTHRRRKSFNQFEKKGSESIDALQLTKEEEVLLADLLKASRVKTLKGGTSNGCH